MNVIRQVLQYYKSRADDVSVNCRPMATAKKKNSNFRNCVAIATSNAAAAAAAVRGFNLNFIFLILFRSLVRQNPSSFVVGISEFAVRPFVLIIIQIEIDCVWKKFLNVHLMKQLGSLSDDRRQPTTGHMYDL